MRFKLDSLQFLAQELYIYMAKSMEKKIMLPLLKSIPNICSYIHSSEKKTCIIMVIIKIQTMKHHRFEKWNKNINI